MSTYVLVHGAFVGGWIWRKTAKLMSANGHEVFTPTLTGMGERIHLVNRDIGLETYLQDVINLVKYEDLHNVILVGHSLGGMTITGVAGRIPERLAHVVYLDAALPESGQSFADLSGPENIASTLPYVNAFDGYRLPPPPDAPQSWDPQPVKPAVDPLVIDHPDALALLPHTFIYCTADKSQPDPGNLPIIRSAECARNDPRWNYIETANAHNIMLEDPECTANLLMKVA